VYRQFLYERALSFVAQAIRGGHDVQPCNPCALINHALTAPTTCISHSIAILLHDYCAICNSPPTHLVYAVHYTTLVIAISFKGQVYRQFLYERALSFVAQAIRGGHDVQPFNPCALINHPLTAPTTCISHSIAILLNDYCAICNSPPTHLVYAVHYTTLVIAISFKGQVYRQFLYERALSFVAQAIRGGHDVQPFNPCALINHALTAPTTCISHSIAILLHDYCAICNSPPIHLLHAIHDRLLVIAISFIKGQVYRQFLKYAPCPLSHRRSHLKG